MSSNDELFERAQKVIPGGVNSPVRAFRSVGGSPYFVERGEGPWVWDSEGRRYLDFVQSWGASILGHAHPDVVAAAKSAIDNGSSFGAPTEREVRLAETICDRVAGCEMVRLVSSGTEATMSAIRVARGFTGRDTLVKFAGCYHGHSDALLVEGGSGVATLGLVGSAGVPQNAVANTQVVPYNEVPQLDDSVAAVIVEPCAGNMGLVAPVDGFLAGLRAECDRVGALLIFDEVISGFRVAKGGMSSYSGVKPDLWCFGKVIGGGFPMGAFAGRREVMSLLAPLGDVYQAGTLSGNPVATAAGLAVLEHLDESAYEMLSGRARDMKKVMEKAFDDAGVQVHIPVVGPLLGIFFGVDSVTNYDEAKASAANGQYAKFFRAMLQRNIALPPSPYEVLFPSLAHTWDDLERMGDAVTNAIAAADLH